MEITCPSGLRGRIRKMTGKEQGQLLSRVGGGKGGRKRGRGGDRMDKLLAACWEETLEQGVYRWGDGKPDWPNVLSGDRYYTLLKIRQKTYGSRYSFKARCGEPACRASFNWGMNLEDLEVRELPKESKEIVVNGGSFVLALPDEQEAEFHLQRGSDEGRFGGDVDPLTAAIMTRLVRIGDVKDPKKLTALVEETDADVLDLLWSEMEAADCGVETSFEVECPECGGETTIVLPLDRTFFMPRSMGRRIPTS